MLKSLMYNVLETEYNDIVLTLVPVDCYLIGVCVFFLYTDDTC